MSVPADARGRPPIGGRIDRPKLLDTNVGDRLLGQSLRVVSRRAGTPDEGVAQHLERD
jgi:hypothetical protein